MIISLENFAKRTLSKQITLIDIIFIGLLRLKLELRVLPLRASLKKYKGGYR
jgi:hypothetical protein